MQPFTLKSIWILLFGCIAGTIAYFIPVISNLFIDGILRTPVFIILFGTLILSFKISEDSQVIFNKMLGFIGIKR